MDTPDDFQSWIARERIPSEAVKVLEDQGFTSLDDIKKLTPDDVKEYFQDNGLLKVVPCMILMKAVAKLSQLSLDSTESSAQACSSTPNLGSPSYPHSSTYARFLTSRVPAYSTVPRQFRTQLQPQPQQVYSPHIADGASAWSGNRRTGGNFGGADYRPSLTLEREQRDFRQHRSWRSKQDGNTVRLLILGKTGSGKSTTGNTILGQKLFDTAPDFGSVTSECERRVGFHGDTRIEIMDSPGLYDTSKSHEEICTIIIQAVAGMHPGPHAVLYVMKVGRFTEEEYNAYGRLKALFDENIPNHMILLFTHGDNLERQGHTLEQLMASPKTPENLRKVFTECGHRCLLINNMADDPGPQVDRLLREVQKLVAVNGGRPYSCPQYSKIGEELEKEVNKRMEKYEKKDLQRQKRVQELEKRTRQAKQEAEKMRQQIQQKEREREREMREKQQQTQEVEQKLLDQLKIQHQLTQQQQKELEQLKQERGRLGLEQRRLQQKQEELRRREMEEMDRRQKAFERNREKEREEDKRREEQRKKEMERIKQGVVDKEEPGFFEKLADVVTHPFRKLFRLFRS